MSALATYVLNFSDSPVGNEGYLDISVDPKRNNGKSLFDPGDPVVLNIITSSSILDNWTSSGTLSPSGNTVDSFTEYFAVNTKYKTVKYETLQYIPNSGSIAYSWLGQDNGNVTFDGRKVNLPSGLYFGYLKISYETDILLYTLDNVPSDYSEQSICVFFVNTDLVSANYIVRLNQDDIELEDNPSVSIVVKDFTSEDIVPGTIVQVDGETVGVTDANGYCYIGILSKGRHDLKLIPPAPYLDSDLDGLANDWFTID